VVVTRDQSCSPRRDTLRVNLRVVVSRQRELSARGPVVHWAKVRWHQR
jgi:hypothetical protein